MNWDVFWHKTLGRPYKLYTSVYGNRSKPVIILLHGIAATSEDWSPLVPLLSTNYFCITLDLLGFANSPKPQWANYTMEDHLESIRYTIRGLGLHQPFILAGHSLGSLLATAYAQQHPRDIARLLLLSPPVYPPLGSIEKKLALGRTNLLIKLYKFLRTHPKMTPENIRRLSMIAPLPKSITIHPETWIPFFRTMEHCIEQQTIMQDIRDITAPIDIFYGSLDTVVVGYNVRQLTKIKDVRIHTFRGNHGIGRSYAKAVAAQL